MKRVKVRNAVFNSLYLSIIIALIYFYLYRGNQLYIHELRNSTPSQVVSVYFILFTLSSLFFIFTIIYSFKIILIFHCYLSFKIYNEKTYPKLGIKIFHNSKTKQTILIRKIYKTNNILRC